MWRAVFTLTFRGASAEQLQRLPKDKPIHLVGGGQDPATDNARATEWLSRRLAGLGFRAVTTRIYPDMRHEMLNETGREGATADFVGWCNNVTGSVRA
jgi:alpha-beta hydrolase superfamily lysophospholipase